MALSGADGGVAEPAGDCARCHRGFFKPDGVGDFARVSENKVRVHDPPLVIFRMLSMRGPQATARLEVE